MGHRDMSNQFMISGLHQDANNHPPVEQSYIPTVRTVATDNGHFVAPMDHTLRGGSNSHWNFGGSYNEHHTSFVSMEARQVPPILEAVITRNFGGSITSVYRNGPPSHCNYTNGSSSSTNELHFPFEAISTRYSSHSRAGGWDDGYRNGRPRMAVPRLPPIVDVMGVHDRLGRETLTADQLSFYHNSMNFPDQYQDMRLDIDEMSYEELLALEERIGNVSTGLSEEGMFECLSEQVYCSIDQIQEDDSCSICLEEFKNGEKVGRMKKCGHDYHVDCIKKWLVMKKICPVCKSECSNKA